ncbi:SWIM zinc finger family protein [Luteimonas sp. SJ-92]|uniref:SWIM zinc finger family protein n=1 Tax=Luteimonas salinisoli TaxID=2752307 RepID=A0A853J9V7_9GAMM|nr:SWIM zinc finger family protein [Luteimonas salinisoli]NZA25467.1 SWIM zinc finger family protein [Luteimonas salinisoli]
MKPLRLDLLELTPEALMALANPGFVKRALRDIAAGALPQIEEEPDGTVRARYSDGQCATLPPGRSLREAACSCPASGLCRHRVTLVLAYQRWAADTAAAHAVDKQPEAPPPDSTEWSPARFDDAELAALPAATLEMALRLASAQPAVRVTAWHADAPVPAASLPMCSVRFFSRSNLMHARCDCKKGSGCEHVVLAVWAFRQARALQPGQSQVVELVAPTRADKERRSWFDPQAESPAPDLDAVLLQLWLDGSSQPPMALEARFEAFRNRCVAAGWCWVVEALDEVRQLLTTQHARSSGFDPMRLLAALAELPARLFAARRAELLAISGATTTLPTTQILGVGIKGEVALDHLRLVSLGAECWQGEQIEGVRIAFADPDTQAVTVLERSWAISPGKSAGAQMARRVAGQSVRQLACGQIVTKGARRRANGVIEIVARASETSVLPLSARSWDTLGAPLRQPSGRALVSCLMDAHPDFVRPKQAIEHLHVLPIARVLEWGWDAATQTLHAQVLSATQGPASDEDVVRLSLQHRAAASCAVDAFARVLGKEWGVPMAVAGIATVEAGRLRMQPLSILTEQRAVVLDAEQVAKQSLPSREADASPSPLGAVVQATLDLLVSWLRQGLRHQGAGAMTRGLAQVDALRQAGLCRASAELQGVIDDIRGSDRNRLPTRLAGLVLLLRGVARESELDPRSC